MFESCITLLDPEVMRLSFGEDRQFTCDTMCIYLRDAPTLAKKCLAAIRASDNEELTQAAHALKGITGYFTKNDAYKHCLDLEYLGRENGLPLRAVHGMGLLSSINVALEQICREMKSYIEG